MTVLIIILILVAIIAIYPFIRDYIRRQKAPFATYTEGLCLLLDGKDNEAIEKLKLAVTKDSNNVDAYLRLAELFSKKGETERASKIFERLMLRRNLTSEQEKKVYQSLANYYLKTDRLQRAITILEELVNFDASNVVHYETLLGLYSKTERWQDCEELLKKLEKVQKNKEKMSDYYIEFGKKILARNPEEAAKYFKQGLGFNRKSAEALITLGDYYYNKREIDMAIKIWNELLEYYPSQNSLVRNRLEAAYYDLGQYEEIVNLYERLLKKVPDDTGLYFALAQIHAKKEEIDTAIKILTKVPATKKKDVLPQIALASLYLKRGDTNKARQTLDNLLENLTKEA